MYAKGGDAISKTAHATIAHPFPPHFMADDPTTGLWNYKQVQDKLKRSKRSIQGYIKSGELPASAIKTDPQTGEKLFEPDAVKKLRRNKGLGETGASAKGAGVTSQALGAQSAIAAVTTGFAGEFQQQIQTLQEKNSELHEKVGKYEERSASLQEINEGLRTENVELKGEIAAAQERGESLHTLSLKLTRSKTRWQTGVIAAALTILIIGIAFVVISIAGSPR